MRAVWFWVLSGLAAPASAADILGAYYDARTDEIVVDIAFRGTTPDHDFRVEWGPCAQGGVAGRLIDQQGKDAARTAYRVTERLSLHELPCRPALVTLRLGRSSQMSVEVPG